MAFLSISGTLTAAHSEWYFDISFGVATHMSTRRAHIVLPDDLLDQIDELVGSRGRSQFIAELARAEVHRQRLLKLLGQQGPGWKLENHPELKQGAAGWIDSVRQEDEKIDAETDSR